MASQLYPAPVRSEKRQRVAAWIACALALVYPLMAALGAIMLQLWNLSGRGNPAIDLLSSAVLMAASCVWPLLPIIAIFLASLVLVDARGRNWGAWAAVAIGTLSILVRVGAALIAAEMMSDLL